ncbi:MAG TPA: hypothetical protein VNH11_23265 [Pirellulales bacterium]|nr:hypothetical protein [Pirellulales bacterium]
MRLAVLILLTALLPLGWGWITYWLVTRFWPERGTKTGDVRPADRPASPYDYQI